MKFSSLRRIFRALPYPIQTAIKVIVAARYYIKIWTNDIGALLGKVPGSTRIILLLAIRNPAQHWLKISLSQQAVNQ